MQNILNIPSDKFGRLLLRVGLASVYIYFGVSQILDPSIWAGIVPDWALFVGLSAKTIVIMNGIFEIIFSILLILGIWTVPVSFILAAHLAVITFIVGFNPTGVRDFGLTLATLAHGFLEMKREGQGQV